MHRPTANIACSKHTAISWRTYIRTAGVGSVCSSTDTHRSPTVLRASWRNVGFETDSCSGTSLPAARHCGRAGFRSAQQADQVLGQLSRRQVSGQLSRRQVSGQLRAPGVRSAQQAPGGKEDYMCVRKIRWRKGRKQENKRQKRRRHHSLNTHKKERNVMDEVRGNIWDFVDIKYCSVLFYCMRKWLMGGGLQNERNT
jgi:hypothetical protein